MFDRILGHIQAYKVRRRVLILLREGKLGVNNAESELARAIKRLDMVGALEHEVHASTMVEVREEGEQLCDLFLSHDLDAGQAGFPFLVDGDNHSAAGNGK